MLCSYCFHWFNFTRSYNSLLYLLCRIPYFHPKSTHMIHMKTKGSIEQSESFYSFQEKWSESINNQHLTISSVVFAAVASALSIAINSLCGLSFFRSLFLSRFTILRKLSVSTINWLDTNWAHPCHLLHVAYEGYSIITRTTIFRATHAYSILYLHIEFRLI